MWEKTQNIRLGFGKNKERKNRNEIDWKKMNSQIDKKISDIVNKLVLEIELVKK